jgi:hypothetical protein
MEQFFIEQLVEEEAFFKKIAAANMAKVALK